MRASLLGAVPLVAALAVSPASAQISGRVHVDIPIGRGPGAAYGAPRRQVVVREYDPYQFGDWNDYYDDWSPVTLYYYDGYYYDYPIVEYARPIVVYNYRSQYFLAPRDRAFQSWIHTYRPQAAYGRDYRPYIAVPRGRDNRDDRGGRDDRRDGGYAAGNYGNGRVRDNGYSNGQGRYQPGPQGGGYRQPQGGNGRPQDGGYGRSQGGGRSYQPPPQSSGNARGGRPGDQGGRSRPHP